MKNNYYLKYILLLYLVFIIFALYILKKMAKKELITEEKVINTPAGGVLIGKDKQGQTIIPNDGSLGGFLIGRLHKDGGIKAINKSTGQPLEMQSNEVVITAPAVADQTKREFEGKMLTNREILSKINERGGGVSLADGGELPSEVFYNGSSYKYGGKTMTDYEIIQEINSCYCEHSDYKKGGHLAEGLSLRDIADIHNISITELKKQVRAGLKVESEHTSSKREQMKIVKDHLLENPKYYTLLQKAGLAKGGLIAPNGNKSNLTAEQYKLVRTPEFKEWFGDWENDPKNASKVVDENGEPLVVYHGTNSDFSIFNRTIETNYRGKNEFIIENVDVSKKEFEKIKKHNEEVGAMSSYEDFWFSNVNWMPDSKYVLACFLNCKKLYVDENGQGGQGAYNSNYGDGLKITNADGQSNVDYYVVKNSNQIKLADGTNTTFNSSSNDIRYNKGGMTNKENLVKDAKSGNTPARDLNNYNDVLDVDADGVVGAETGLYANGGDVDFDVDGTGGADASSGVGAFEDGGEVEEYAEGGEVTNPMVSNWDNINSSWKDTSKVKKIVWANNPYDKGLYSIVAPYLGKDELRPVMSGINFDENGITATNAHVLITLPYPNKKYEGIYEPDLSKRKDSDQITIDGKYPNYSAVIPFSDDTTHFLIDVYKLLQYTNVAMKYANKTTYQIAYKLNNEAVGYNGRFMVENLKTLLKLGHEKVYAHYIAPNKAMVLSPSKDYRVGNDEILLTMPVMLKEKFYGARDYEWDNKVSRELSVYFDFDDNEIHNSDGSVVDFKMKYENNSAIDVDDVKLLESMVKKNKTLQILNYVVVKDNTLRVTNLKADYVVKNVSLPDGIYLPSNGNLEITMNPIDDYPREPVFVSDEDTIEFTIPSTVFEYYIDRFKFVLDQDDLRPIFKGISLKHTSDNKLFLLGTDSKLGLKIDITKYVDIPLYNREIQTVIDPLWLFAFLDKLEEGALHIKSNKVATIIDSESKSFYCKNVDGNYPNLEAVIPQESDDLVSIEYSALKKCLNNEFIKNYKKHTDKYEMVGVFDKDGELFVGRRSKKVTNPEFKDIEKLCDVTFESSKEEYRYDGQSVLLAMPLIAEQQDNFAFEEELLSKVMTIVNDSVIQMHHNGTKRAFLIPIHSFEYEKTTIEHKTREQKPTIEQEQMIAEVEEIDEIKEAIEVMQMLLETAPKKDKKEIVEAIEVMEMLLESYQN